MSPAGTLRRSISVLARRHTKRARLSTLLSSPTMGEMLLEAAREHPEQTVRVYCRHTHGKGIYTIANITVFTGDAKYRGPKINGIIEL